jgi:hypothetical protein
MHGMVKLITIVMIRMVMTLMMTLMMFGYDE